MDYWAFTSGSPTLMHEAVRVALVSDDAQEQRGEDPRFRSRYAGLEEARADLEVEMLRRGMLFSVIEWHEGRRSYR